MSDIMEGIIQEKTLNEDLDVLGQEFSTVCTQICLCYSFPDTSSHFEVLHLLTVGLERLTAAFPWVAGRVSKEGHNDFKIRPLQRLPRLTFKDYRDDSSKPTMDSLRTARFPISMLDESWVCPTTTIMSGTGDSEVLHLQANFIRGGLLLTFTTAHAVMDMSAQGQVMYLFHKACCNDPFTSEELSSGNLPRRHLVSLFDESWKEGAELDYQIFKPRIVVISEKPAVKPTASESAASRSPTSSSPATRSPTTRSPTSSSPTTRSPAPTSPAPTSPASSSPVSRSVVSNQATSESVTSEQTTAEQDSAVPPKSTWTNFAFSAKSLTSLKERASVPMHIPAGFVSTDDALSALIWKSVARARSYRLKARDEVKIGRAVDVRRFVGIPTTYTGLMQNMVYGDMTHGKLTTTPIDSIAQYLRTFLDPKKLEYNMRSLVTFYSRLVNKSRVSFMATIDPSKDILLSSWAKEKCYELDFGLGLGKPECVRRPQFAPFESLMYLLPKAPDGSITAAICLRDEDLERLQQDVEFMMHVDHVA